MFAACIPLKPVQSEDTERNQSTSKLEAQRNPSDQTMTEEDHVFTSAIWWRKVNRGMSIIGLLMVGAIIALIVTGVRAHWGH